jgi:hypothetical protein
VPLEISEDLVSLAYQSLGYFVIEGRKAGRREVDLLALRLGEDGEVAERLHIEIQVSVNPIGVLRDTPGLGRTAQHPEKSARAWVRKKFREPRVVEAVKQAFQGKEPRRVLVHGRLTNPKQLDVITATGVTCIEIGKLVNTALKDGKPNRLHRAVEIAKLLTMEGTKEAT